MTNHSHAKLNSIIATQKASIEKLYHALEAAHTAMRHMNLGESSAEAVMGMADRIAETRIVLDEVRAKLTLSETRLVQTRVKLADAHRANNLLDAENLHLRDQLKKEGIDA